MSETTVRVCLLGTRGFIDDSIRVLRQSAVQVVAQASSSGEAIEFTKDLGAELVIVDIDCNDDGIAVGAQVAQALPDYNVILASANVGFDIYRRAKSKGIGAVVRKPLVASEIVSALNQIMEEDARRIPQSYGRGEPTTGTKGLRERLTIHRDEAPERSIQPIFAKQEIMVFYSPKGGVGKTTLSGNIGAHFAKSLPKARVLAIDLDIHARLASTLEVDEKPNILDWEQIDVFDSRAVEKACIRHGSGLYILPGLERAIQQTDLSRDLVNLVFDTARRHFDLIVVDCGPDFYDSTIIALERATKIFIVGTLDIPTLRDIKKVKDDFDLIGIDETKCNVVLNRIPKKPDLDIRELARLLPYPLAAKIPEDPMVQLMINRGAVLTVTKPDAAFSQELIKLASGLAPIPEATKRRGFSLFSWLHRRKEVAL